MCGLLGYCIECGLLVLHFLLELGDLIPQLLDDHIHVDGGVLGTAGHGVWVFWVGVDRAPKFSESFEALFSARQSLDF